MHPLGHSGKISHPQGCCALTSDSWNVRTHYLISVVQLVFNNNAVHFNDALVRAALIAVMMAISIVVIARSGQHGGTEMSALGLALVRTATLLTW